MRDDEHHDRCGAECRAGAEELARKHVNGEDANGADDDIDGEHTIDTAKPSADGQHRGQHLGPLGLNNVSFEVPRLPCVGEHVGLSGCGLNGAKRWNVGRRMIGEPHATERKKTRIAHDDEVLRGQDEPNRRPYSGTDKHPPGT